MQVFATRKVTAMGRALPRLTIKYREAVRVMKITGILLFAACMQVSANGLGQTITINVKEAPIQQVMKAIEKQTDYVFFYRSEWVKDAKKVTVVANGLPLEKVLDICFREQSFGYSIAGKYITIVPKKTSNNNDYNYSPTDENTVMKIDVKGKVVNEKGEPVIATVQVKGTDRRTTTDENGEFQIKVIDENSVLIISGVNIQTFEWEVSGKLELLLTAKIKTLIADEVNVTYSTGYQDVPRERATGSFVQINNDLFNRRVGPSILLRIADLTPGMLNRKSGSPNELDDITIRGVNTINSNKRPLIVLDNFIYEGDITSINVNDIESVTVLKDASAASIWGVRAGNGVIVLTTKNGKYNQRNILTIRSDIIIGMKPDLTYIPAIPSSDIIALERKRFADSIYNKWDDVYPSNKNFTALPVPVEILLMIRKGTISKTEGEAILTQLESHDIRDDIKKYLLQTSITQQYALNVSGGSGNYRYYGSAGFNRTRPNAVNISNEQTTMRFNQTFKVFKNLEVNSEINWSRAVNRNHNLLQNDPTYWSHPYTSLADEQGNALAVPKDYRLAYVDTVSAKGLLDWHYRPLDESRTGNLVATNQFTRILGSLKYTVFPGLSVTASYQWNKGTNEIIDQKSTEIYFTRNEINRVMQTDANGNPVYPYPLGTIYDESNSDITNWNFRGQVNWNKTWGRNSIYSLAGVETRETIIESIKLPKQYGLNPETFIFFPIMFGNWTTRPEGSTVSIGPGAAEKIQMTDRYGSYYSNFSYSYLDKYVATISGRIDKSNYFGVKSNDRIKPLWHVGLAWTLSKENFYRLNWLPFLRLRATYGYSGNTTPVSPLATARILQGSSPLFLPTAAILTPPNPQLRWERVKTINLAMDFGLKNNRLSGTVETYYKNGIDLISTLPVDPTTGFEFYTGNNASIRGKGWDVLLNSKNMIRIFQWQTTLIFSYNTEKVTSYLIQPPQTAAAYLQNPVIIGRPLSYLTSYRWAGLDPTSGDAQIYIDEKISGSKSISNAKPGDLFYNGPRIPQFFGSLRNDFSFQNISLSVNLNYRLGYIFRRSSFQGSLTINNTWAHKDFLTAWKKSGDEKLTNVPGFLESYPDRRYEAYQFSNILIEKGDHIRLQDIRLTYDFKKNLLQRIRLSAASLYIYANNLGIIWKANKYDLDPESAGFGATPLPKTFSIGLQVTL